MGIIWKVKKVNVKEEEKGPGLMLHKVTEYDSGTSFFLFDFHGPIKSEDKKMLWTALEEKIQRLGNAKMYSRMGF